MGKSLAKKLTASERDHLLSTLKERFEKNMQRHKGISWNQVEARLNEQQDKLWSLQAMEATGGEPDVVQLDKKSGALFG